jgi:uracil phosphoribosyltransferase
MTVICEEGLATLNPSDKVITTPTGSEFAGHEIDTSKIVAVTIIRAGDSMLECFLDIVPESAVGKILIQRNEDTAEPELFYSKLPPLTGKQIVLLDPMLATGGSAACAVDVLIAAGAAEEDISFFNVVCCPEGLDFMCNKYPKLHIITGSVDECLNGKKYIVPGLGDYGDRFFNSV